MRRIPWLAAATVITVMALALFAYKAWFSGRCNQALRMRLLYEGCRSGVSPNPLLVRNWFEKGERASFEFEVENLLQRDLRVTFLLKPLSTGDAAVVKEEVVKAGERKRVAFEIDTCNLEGGLYKISANVEGVGEIEANTAPFNSTNLDSYPWLLAVLSGPARCLGDPLDGLPKLTVGRGLGVNIHFIAPGKVEELDLDMIAYAGFSLVRMDLFWHEVERSAGSYDFSGYDVLTSELKERGLRPLYILDYGNPLYENGLPPRTDSGVAAFAMYARKCVETFGDYAIYEIWNEPNIPGFWKPMPNASDYARLAKAAIQGIREVCRRCVVLAPATSGVDADFIARVSMLGVLEHVDAVSVHPYRSAPPETALNDLENLRNLVGGKAIVISEWGYPTGGGYGSRVDLIKQAQYIVRVYLVSLLTRAPITIIYDWKDDGLSLEDSEHNFGLVAHHVVRGHEWFLVKPAYFAIYNFNRLLCGFSPVGTLNTSGAYSLVFERDGERRIVLWSEGPEVEVELNLEEPEVEVFHLFGGVERLRSESGVYAIKVDGFPRIVGLPPRRA